MKASYHPISQTHIFLDHAKVSVPSQPALDAMQAYTQSLSQPFDLAQHEKFLNDFKLSVRDLLRISSEHSIAPIAGTAFGLSAIALSLPLKRFDNILIYGEEYPANYYPWAALAYNGVLVKVLPPNKHGGLRVDDIVEYTDSYTRAIVVSSVQFKTGHRTDIASLGQYCHERKIILVVDGNQSVGALPLYPEQLGVHALVTGSQKWLLGPFGSGFMYVNDYLASKLTPQGPLGANSVENPSQYLPYRFSLRPGAERFELGTTPVVAHHGLNASIGLILEVKLDKIENLSIHLSRILVEDLKKRGYDVLGSSDWKERSPITTFRTRNPNHAKKQLENAKIVVTHRDGLIRVSPHYYNTENEVLKVGKALDGD